MIYNYFWLFKKICI